MSPAATDKTDRLSKIAQVALTPLVALVAILAIVLIAPMYFKSDVRPDPWTGTDQKQYSQLVDERIANLTLVVDKIAAAVDRHANLDMHNGARVQFTQLAGELSSMSKALERIEKRLEKIEEK